MVFQRTENDKQLDLGYCVFVDVLGFSNLIEKADPLDKKRESFKKFMDAFIGSLQHLKWTKKLSGRKFSYDLLKMSDGRMFVNYLSAILGYEKTHWEMLWKHKISIQKALRKYSSKTEIFEKYKWAAEYHNYFCARICNEKGYDEDYKIAFGGLESREHEFLLIA